ncbi:MAG: hypothetical protein NTW29_02040 [Bacteroidetes bacterium]|nr:hypothetical protein [Bacteroidota bacterium]
MSVQAQNPTLGVKQLPFKVTIFTESIGLPNFGRFFKQSGFGVRIGTEFYYANKKNDQFFQTVNMGFYSHKKFASAFFISTEAGYRRYFGSFFTDATLGGGIQFSRSALPAYKPSATGFEKSGGNLVRFMPVVGLGTGYSFNKTAVFARYEVFGEMPFGYQGVSALPHQTIHVGAQLHL